MGETKARIPGLQRKVRKGLRRIGSGFLCRHRRFILSAQAPDGGFAGREGGADLYYTHFGLRAADVLGLDGADDVWTGAAGFFEGVDGPVRDVVECYCEAFGRAVLARVAHPPRPGAEAGDRTARLKDACRSELPGGGRPAGLYRVFLAYMALELLGERPPADAVARFVMDRRCADGGFGDTENAERGSLNPTAAGILLLCRCGSEDEAAGAGEFLAELQQEDGGFPAHPDAPASDLMSTFTALVALGKLGRLDRVRLGGAARFARGLAADDGGFLGAPGDKEVDVEYSFYGLGVIGLLSHVAGAAGKDTDS